MTEELPPLTEWAKNALEKSFQKFPGRPLRIPDHHIAEVEELVRRGLVKKKNKRPKGGKAFSLYYGVPLPDDPPPLDMEVEPDPK